MLSNDLLIPLCCLVLVASCYEGEHGAGGPSEPIIHGNGIIVTDTISGTSFTMVDLWEVDTAAIMQGDECTAIVSADQNLLGSGHLTSRVKDNELDIAPWINIFPTKLAADITLPRLTQLHLYRSTCSFSGGLDSDTTVRIPCIQSGLIGTLNAPGLHASIYETAFTLHGDVPHIFIETRDANSDFSDLHAAYVKVIGDGATVKLYCTDSLIVTGRDHTRIYYRGDPYYIDADLDNSSVLMKL